MIRIKREHLLQTLESVQPGLSVRDILEQSSCFVFRKSMVMTYNEEIACRRSIDFKLNGAVQAEPLLKVLRKLAEEDIALEVTEGELVVHGKKRKAGIRMEQDITLPIDHVDNPDEWHPLHEEFADAVYIVQQCASKDASEFNLTCLHITSKFIEAFDNYQAIRYRLKTGMKTPALVKQGSIKNITALGMTEFSETDTWLHFRNPSGLIMSCRRYVSEAEGFLDLTNALKADGVPANLPKGLVEACDRADIFSSENKDENQVTVELRPGKLRVKGVGVSGWYSEIKSLKYDGPALTFMIGPKLLIELTKRYNECEITEEKLKVNGGKFIYVTSLGQVEETATTKKKKSKKTEDEE